MAAFRILLAFIFLVLFLVSAFAQHEGMQMPMPPPQGRQMDMSDGTPSFIQQTLAHDTSGTSAEPDSIASPMLMKMHGGWGFMFHGNAFLVEEQQSGARGGDKFFSTNWFMAMAQHDAGKNGQLTLRAMFSLEPTTVTGRFYPELFQQGETVFGRPINDGQHPHDLFMEIAALYDFKPSDHTLLSFYAAPVGDPAMGPAAYAHRASASEDPIASLGHHLQDSTHIAADVVTIGLTHKIFRVEASGFHGREPDEDRWDIDLGRIDSWSTRFILNPAANWSMQYSIGRLASPEALHPDEDILRMTASVMYNRPMPRGEWASTLLYGRNRNLPSQLLWSSYLAESTLRFAERNRIWTRIENVDRTNELLLGRNPEPSGFIENMIGRVQAYSFGYDREFRMLPHLATAFGGQVTWYGVPDSLRTTYGSHPAGVAVFMRLRPAEMHYH